MQVLLRRYQRELARMQGEMKRIEALEAQKRELVGKLREASGFVLDADLVRENEMKVKGLTKELEEVRRD